MKEEQHIQDLFNTIRELPPEVELAGIEQFVLAQPVTAFQPPAGGDGGTSGLLTIKNTIVMISSISIIGSVALFLGGGNDKPSAATVSVTDTPTQQTLVLDSAPVLVEHAPPLAVSPEDDVALVRRPVNTYPLTPNLDTAYPPNEIRYGVGINVRYPQPVAKPAPPVAPAGQRALPECGDETQVFRFFVQEMVKENLIDPKHFSVRFTDKTMEINNRRQPDDTYGRYKALFERVSGTRVGNGTHLYAFVDDGRCSVSLSLDNEVTAVADEPDAPSAVSYSNNLRRVLPPFSQIKLQCSGMLRIVADTGYSIEMMAEDEKEFGLLKTEVENDALVITNGARGRKLYAVLILTLPADKLKGVTVSGSGNAEIASEFNGVSLLDVEGSGGIRVEKLLGAKELHAGVSGSGYIQITDLVAQKLVVSVPGSGSVEASGLSDDVKVDISGSGVAELDKLHVQTASCDIGGSGSIMVQADREIKVTISGSGVVTYSGSPIVIQQITGSGMVERR